VDSLVQDDHPVALVYRRNSVIISNRQPVAQFFQSGHENRTADAPFQQFFWRPGWHFACCGMGQDVKMANELPTPDALRYLDADHVEHPSGTFAGVTVCSQDDQQLGSISGVLVEPTTRRIRYFVVKRGGLLPRRYLLAADTPAVLEASDQQLRILSNVDDLERFEAQQVAPFSEEDAVTAMFAHPAA
jgi:hypothetical protein